MLVGGVPAEEYRQERYERGQRPHVEQRVQNGALSHGDRVLERADDGVVPVHADTAQVQYGRRREVHVQAVPDVTHDVTKHPLAGDLDAGVERHGAQGHQEVGESQRHHVVVGEYAELAVPDHADHHQRVAQHGAQYYRAHGHRFDDEHRAHRGGHAAATVIRASRCSDAGPGLVPGHRLRRLVALADPAPDTGPYAAARRTVTANTRLRTTRSRLRSVVPPCLWVHGGRPTAGRRSHRAGVTTVTVMVLSATIAFFQRLRLTQSPVTQNAIKHKFRLSPFFPKNLS